MRDTSAPRRLARHRRRRLRQRREPPRCHRRPRASGERPSGPTLYSSRITGRTTALRTTARFAPSIRNQDSRVQDLCGACLEAPRSRPATWPRNWSRRPEASDERARLFHRLLAVHRLPGVRAGLRGMRHAPRRSIINLETIERRDSVQTAPQVCMHCEDPICAQVCPADAIKKTDEGIVQSLAKAAVHRVLELRAGVPVRRAEVRGRDRPDDEVRHVLRPH